MKPPSPHNQAGDPDGLLRRWVAAFVLGELVGFIPPAVTGAVLGGIGVSDAVLILALTGAGALEGAALGFAQSRVLAQYLAELDGRRWVAWTAAAAAFAWFVGMSGPAVIGAAADGTGPLTLSQAIVLMIPLWVCGLLGMGFGQWLVLRDVVEGCRRWIPVTAAAWSVGVMIPVAALSAIPDTAPGPLLVAVAVLSAVAMGVTVAALTGTTLRNTIRRHRTLAA